MTKINPDDINWMDEDGLWQDSQGRYYYDLCQCEGEHDFVGPFDSKQNALTAWNIYLDFFRN